MREPDSSPGEIQLLRDGREVFPAWLASIAAAEREILLEMYWFDSDATGQKFSRALTRRARDGLDVYVIYDAVGSLGAEESFFEEMAENGVAVRQYHPIAPWHQAFRFGGIAWRDHRKVLCVDAEVAYTGGVNICDVAAPREEGGQGWRDDCVRVRGPVVADMRALFFDTWFALRGPPPKRCPPVPRRTRRQAVAAALQQVHRPTGLAAPGLAVRALAVVDPSPMLQLLASPSRGARRTIRRQYLARIAGAQVRILIENSYFIPDGRFRRALARAVRRGVEVRVIMPRDSDVATVQWAARALYARLMLAGIHIHEWVDGMMHAKTALIDGWATVGSYNLDRRSLRYNLEVNVASTLPEFVAQVEASLRDDLARCEEVDRLAWRKRPWWRKVVERIVYAFRNFL